MKFRSARPSEIGEVDALIVPIFKKGEAPEGLSRGLRSTIGRVHAEAGGERLYHATTHVGGERGIPTRLVVVNAGDPKEWSVERARNVASAGVKSLWRSTAK